MFTNCTVPTLDQCNMSYKPFCSTLFGNVFTTIINLHFLYFCGSLEHYGILCSSFFPPSCSLTFCKRQLHNEIYLPLQKSILFSEHGHISFFPVTFVLLGHDSQMFSWSILLYFPQHLTFVVVQYILPVTLSVFSEVLNQPLHNINSTLVNLDPSVPGFGLYRQRQDHDTVIETIGGNRRL